MSQDSKNLGNILGESWQIFHKCFKKMFLFSSCVYALMGIVMLLFSVRNEFLDEKPIANSIPVSFVIDIIVLMTFFAVIYYLFQVAIMKIIQASQKGEGPSYQECLKGCWPSIVSLVFIGILILVRAAIWPLIFLLPSGALLYIKPSNASQLLWVNGIIQLFTFAGLITVFTIIVFYFFSNYAFLVDGKKGHKALRFSKTLVKTNIWSFLGYSIVLIIITTATGLIAQAIIRFLFGKTSLNNLGVFPMAGFILEYVIQGVVSVFYFIFFYCLYEELKKRTNLPA